MSAFSGIEINVEALKGITIQPDGETAIIQAGVNGAEVIETLWDKGYVTSTCSVSQWNDFIADIEFF